MLIAKESLRTVSFKVEPELLQELDIYALNHGMTRSDAIREAIKLLVKEKCKQQQ